MALFGIIGMAGVPVTAVPGNYTLTSTATGGTFILTANSQAIAPLPYNVTAAAAQAAFDAVFGAGEILVTAEEADLSLGPMTVKFVGPLTGGLPATLTVNNGGATGGTVSVGTVSAGVRGSYRGMGNGAVLLDTTNHIAYLNIGTPQVPVWEDYPCNITSNVQNSDPSFGFGV